MINENELCWSSAIEIQVLKYEFVKAVLTSILEFTVIAEDENFTMLFYENGNSICLRRAHDIASKTKGPLKLMFMVAATSLACENVKSVNLPFQKYLEGSMEVFEIEIEEGIKVSLWSIINTN
jgi:hypothetical protein